MSKLFDKKYLRSLCSLLIEARESVPLTQKQVAATKIVSQSELSKIENGQRKLEFLLLIELAELYGKDIHFFIPKKNR
jgi:transcriptional regulator with XRE-family HTH domain